MGALAYILCLYPLYFIRYTVFSLYRKTLRRLWITFVDNFEGRTVPKSRGGSLAVGTYLQRGSAPPPPGPLGVFNNLDRDITQPIITSPKGTWPIIASPRGYCYQVKGRS